MSSPIAFDLDGDGLEYVARANSNVFFDIDNDHFAEHVEWLDGDDGFLVRDLNGNGRIDSVAEMFGDNGGTSAYAKLDALDTNAPTGNVLNSADAAWSSLRVWKDANENGRVDSGELKTLAELNITSIGTASSGATGLSGHAVAGTSTFVMNGATRTAADVLFDTDQMNSWYVGDGTAASTDIDLDTLFLPLSRGYGTLPSLHYAMTQDATLKAMVEEFATIAMGSATNGLYDQLDEILIRWAGAEGVSPTSRGAYTDAQHLRVLERINDQAYVSGYTANGNPNGLSAGRIGEAYALFAEQMLERLLVQGALQGVFANATYSFSEDRLELNDTLGAVIARATAGQPAPGSAAHKIYWNEISRIAEHYAADLGATVLAAKTAIDNAAGFLTLPITVAGTSGNDFLGSFESSDILYGGAGNDTMMGGGGDDIYLFGADSGTDVVHDDSFYGGAYDAIRFETINPASVALNRLGRDLIIAAASLAETITVREQYATNIVGGRQTGYSIDEIQFADGEIWNLATIDGIAQGQIPAPAPLIGAAGNDVLTSGYDSINLIGLGGADRFVIDRYGGNFVTIADFNAAQGDKIDLSAFDNLHAFYQLWLVDLAGHATFSLPGPDGVIQLNISNVGSGQLSLSDILSNSLPYGAGSTLYGSANADTINGTGGDDSVFGNQGDDLLNGGTGRDTLWGWTGNDVINGGYGDDVIGGDQDNDLLSGDSGNDTIYGDIGTDTLNGGDGADTLNGGPGADTIDGGAGMDLASYAGSTEPVTLDLASNLNSGGDATGDVLENVENLLGSAVGDALSGDFANNIVNGGNGNDFLYGGGGGDNSLRGDGGHDMLVGGDGSDWLEGGAGIDYMDGGNGIDAVSYGASYDAVTVNLATGINTGGDAQGDVILQVEWIYGSGHHDTLTGNGNDNVFHGQNGNDVIAGGGGADFLCGDYGSDTIIGGADDDWLDGGALDDLFIFNAGDGVDVIDGFEGEGENWGDVIRLAGIFGLGNFAAVQAVTTYDFVAHQAFINLGGGGFLTVNGVTQAFVSSDFSFG